MIEKNNEYYLIWGMYFWLVWSLLTAMLMVDEYKFIGLAIASLWIDIFVLFIIKKLSHARYIKHNEVLQITWIKYLERKEQVLDYHEKLLIEGPIRESILNQNEENNRRGYDEVIFTTFSLLFSGWSKSKKERKILKPSLMNGNT